jgi:predicted amidohydrolase YtcJ
MKLALALAVAICGAAMTAQAAAPPDVIYVGAHILTMEDKGATAVAVRGDRIVAVGDRATLLRSKGKGTRVVALNEQALLPGFIDAHGHITGQAAQVRMVALAPPPVGAVTSVAGVQDAVRGYIRDKHIAPGQWVVGFGYDDSQLTEQRHPTRADLDAVSTDIPIYLIHASAHLGVVNTAALRALKIDAATADPPGGAIRRVAGSREPDGVLEESANTQVYAALPTLNALPGGPAAAVADAVEQLRIAMLTNAAMGITTVEDGASLPENLAVLRAAAAADKLPLDVVAHVLWVPPAPFPEMAGAGAYAGRLKIGGIKMILDGSPQGKTAYLSVPYKVPPPGKGADYRGAPALPDAAVDAAVREVLGRGLQLQAHANGDAAEQQLIDAVDHAGAQLRRDAVRKSRVVMIHAQTIREDQLDRLKALGMIPSFFPAHTFFWGDWHRDSVLGPERAARISPTRSALDRGLPFTIHNDSPVVPPDILRLIWNATNRVTRSGAVLGPEQRVPVMAALRAVTINAAAQNFEEAIKGSLKPGKVADLVILSADPRAVPVADLRGIKVVETISRGVTVYRAN